MLRPVGRRNLSAGPEQNKTPPRVFVFAPGRVVLFFLLRPFPDADSVTVGRGDPSGRARMVLLFFARAPPGRLLTDCGPGPRCPGPGGVVFFLCCGPAEPGEPITKHVRCTTSGLKRPGGAAATKRKHHFQLIHNVSLIEGLSLRLVTHMRHGCMNISLLPTLGCDCCAVATALHNHNPF